MVGTSKILTVSYGTFSCTLEGFDDSFSTMKAIAEYFRGLAADDRYFGAEPPTPDAEMLAHIAEREISRRVDASMGDDGIHLRAAALTDQSEQDDAAAQAQHDKESRAEVEAARKAAKAAKKAEKAKKDKERAEAKAAKEAEKAAKAKAKAEADLKKAKAKTEADAKAEAEAEAEALADAKANAQAQSDKDAEAAQKAASEAPTTEPSEVDIVSTLAAVHAATTDVETSPGIQDTIDDARSSVHTEDKPTNTEITAPVQNTAPAENVARKPVPSHPDRESVAAKLQRIRAVVGNSEQVKDVGSNDLNAKFLPAMNPSDVAEMQATPDPVAELDTLEAELGEEATPKTGAEDTSDVTSSTMADADGTSTMEGAETPVEMSAPDAAQPRTRVIRMKRSDFEKAKAEEARQKAAQEEANSKTDGPDLGMLDGADDLDNYLEDSDFADDISIGDDAGFSDSLAEIQSDFEDVSEIVSQDDDALEAASENEANADEHDTEDTISAIAAAMAGQVSDKADTSEAEETGETIQAEVEETVFAADETVAADTPQVDDAALDRLLSETDVQMQEPEGSRRRDAIAQLKAAVAAKEAARQVGETDDDDQDVENAFRNDLTEATHTEGTPRPRPVVRSANRTERPRPAPLKLVAAQRVDVEQAAKRETPVVPRRVATRTPDQPAKTAGSFAEFAENMGASDLPDLLEAAAAYTSFVEGAGEFSRPQILRRARAVSSGDFNREDGLRSFADLLRAGRFTKVRNGRFQVSDDSRYNPERRAG